MKKIAVFFAFISSAHGMISQDVVLESAMKHYPAIVQARENLELNKHEVQAAEGAFDSKFKSRQFILPKGYYKRTHQDYWVEKPLPFANSRIFAGYSYGATGVYPTDYSLLSTNNGGTPRVGGSVSLLRGLKIDENRARLKSSRLGLEQAKSDLSFSELMIKRDAIIHYWAWMASLRNNKVYETLLEMAEKRDGVLLQRSKAGDISKVIVTENKQYVARRMAELSNAQLELLQSSLDLSLYLRDSEGAPLKAVNDIPLEEIERIHQEHISRILSEIETKPVKPELAEFSRRPDIVSLGKELEKTNIELALNSNNFLPKFDVDWSYERNLGTGDPTNAPHVWTFLVSLEIPLEFDLLQGQQRTAMAKKNIVQSQFNFLREKVKNELLRNFEGLRLYQQRMESAQAEVKYATELLEAENYKFVKGGSNFFVVNLREENLAQAQSNFIFSQLDFIRAYTELKASTLNL